MLNSFIEIPTVCEDLLWSKWNFPSEPPKFETVNTVSRMQTELNVLIPLPPSLNMHLDVDIVRNLIVFSTGQAIYYVEIDGNTPTFLFAGTFSAFCLESKI